jgi:hypothetical protein
VKRFHAFIAHAARLSVGAADEDDRAVTAATRNYITDHPPPPCCSKASSARNDGTPDAKIITTKIGPGERRRIQPAEAIAPRVSRAIRCEAATFSRGAARHRSRSAPRAHQGARRGHACDRTHHNGLFRARPWPRHLPFGDAGEEGASGMEMIGNPD